MNLVCKQVHSLLQVFTVAKASHAPHSQLWLGCVSTDTATHCKTCPLVLHARATNGWCCVASTSQHNRQALFSAPADMLVRHTCSPRPYENVRDQDLWCCFWAYRLMAFRFTVASSSVWPPLKNTMAAISGGTVLQTQATLSNLTTCSSTAHVYGTMLPTQVCLQHHEANFLPVYLLCLWHTCLHCEVQPTCVAQRRCRSSCPAAYLCRQAVSDAHQDCQARSGQHGLALGMICLCPS